MTWWSMMFMIPSGKCGEIYYLDNQTSEYLSSDIAHFEHYQPWDANTTVVEGKTQIVFYSLVQGSMLILDASTGEIVKEGYPDHHFALRGERDSLPPGIHGSFIPLSLAAGSSHAVFHDSTFYYFTYELRLYGYDVHQRRWLLSECLGDKYPQLKPNTVRTDPDFPLLVGLPNGKLLVLIFHERGVFTMAPLSVRKNDSSLDVEVDVEHIQYFHPHDTSSYPYQGKAM
ncbi:uncharacterized protein LOC132607467 [Lycium barbarum]|uniref:uncharacterized protein LOC132607467 n=1 Tax=Lycium barbarum TaxID=112863 RepID=UPI00293F39CA|nr:uncharacterized protein LOC132607467 [Lycium barbarum]